MKSLLTLTAIAALVVMPASVMADGDDHDHDHDHGSAHADIIVGHNAANQIVIEADLDEAYDLMPTSGGLLGTGFLGDDPGFNVLEIDESPEDFFSFVGDGVNIVVNLQSVTPNLTILNGLAVVGQGSSIALGDDFHEHLDFFADESTTSIGDTFFVSFTLSDSSGTLSDSALYTIELTAVPEPTTAMLLSGMGGLTLLRRRARG